MTQQARVPIHADPTTQEPTIGALVHQLSEDIPQLVRSEIRLAQAEVAEKGKRVGVGLGMFSAAGLLACLGHPTQVANAEHANAEGLHGWAAALIEPAALFLGAGLLALVGKGKVAEAQPLKPERAVAGVQEDIAVLKEVAP
jgi:hypothetical protein